MRPVATTNCLQTACRGHKSISLTVSLLLATIFLLEMFLTQQLSATTHRAGERVIISAESRLEDDLLITAGVGEIDGFIDGDVLVFAKDYRQRGKITGAAIIGAEHATLDGDISHSLLVFCKRAFLSGNVHGSSHIFAQEIEIDEEALFHRDVTLFGERLFMGGTVEGKLRCYVDAATISGKIDGELEISSSDTIRVLETARISGDLIVHGGTALEIEDGAVIVGEVVRLEDESSESDGFAFADVLGFLYNIGALFVLAIVIFSVSRAHFQRSSEAIRQETLRSLAFGLIAFVGGMFLTLALAVTILGLLTAALLFVIIVLFMVLLGPIYAANGLGTLLIAPRRNSDFKIVAARVFVGLVILLTVAALPYAGSILYCFAGIVGFGAFIIGAMPRDSSHSSSDISSQSPIQQ